MGEDYIAKDDEGFDGFQNNFITVLITNAIAWNIPPAAVTALVAYQTTWTAAFAVGGKAERAHRTSVQTKAKTDARKAYEKSKPPQPLGLRAFIAEWITYNSLVSNEQRIALGVPIHKTTKTKHTEATDNTVVFTTIGIGGGVVKSICHSSGLPTSNPTSKTVKTGKATNRAKKEAGYNILKAWMIIKPGVALPVTPDDAGMTKTLFTKARFKQSLGTANIGSLLCEFMQWNIPEHPELSGPWSKMQVTVIN
jgi:hypothetical protein